MKIEFYCQEDTDKLMGLLLKADPDIESIKNYISHSTIFVARESNAIIGVVVITFKDAQYELKNIAVLDSYQGKGIAKELIYRAKDFAKQSGAKNIIVGTGNSSLSQLALYQKCGFRMQSIKKNFFQNYPEPIFENGIPCMDMILLSAKL